MEGFFCGEKKKKDLEFHPVVHILNGLEGKEYVSFQGGSLDIQKFKNSFVCNLWSWARVYIGEETYSLLGFLEWLAAT